MTEVAWPEIALVVAGFGVVFLRLRDLAAQFAGRRSANSPRFMVGAMIGSLVLWTLLAWVLWWPLGWVAGWGWGGQVLLVVVGVVLGAVGMPEIGAGAAITYSLWQHDETLLLWWATPIIGAALLRVLFRTVPWPEGPRSVEGALDRLISYGGVVRPPEVLDVVWRVLHVAAGLVPALLAVLLPFPGASTGEWWLRVAAGLAIAVQVWWFDRLQGSLTRYLGRGSRIGSVLTLGVTLGVAATPVGGLVVAGWRALPGADGLVGGALLVVVNVVVWRLMARATRVQDTGDMAPRKVPALAGLLRDLVLRRGLLVFAAVGLFHPAADVFAGVVLLVGLELVLCLAGSTSAEMRVLLMTDAAQLIGYDDDGRRQVLGWWLYDSFLARPRRPDYRLVVNLTWLAFRSSHGRRTPLGALFSSSAEARTGTGALRWIEIAEEAVDLVESEVVPRFPPRHSAHLRREQHRARWDCQVARATLYQYLNWRDHALTAWRAAAAHAEAAGAPNIAGAARGSAAMLLATRLARPHDALQEIESSLKDKRIASPVRRVLLMAAAVSQVAMDEQDAARTLLAQARALPMKRSDWRAATAEERGSTIPGLGGARGRFSRELEYMDMMITAALDGGEVTGEPSDLQPPAMILVSRALAVERKGDLARARELLEASVRLAARDGHLTWVHNAEIQLAGLADGLEESYRHLRAAIDAVEEMRGRVLDADLRIGAGAVAAHNVYELALMTLVAGGRSDEEGWPDRPNAEAFDLAERARSRVFLELLGESAAQAVPPELASLARAEDEAAQDFRTAVHAQAGASEVERPAVLEAVRTARARLDEVWGELAASGPAGERYARLRRGVPASVDEIREHLRDDVVLAEYFVSEDYTVLFVVRADCDEPEVVVIDMSRADIRTAAAAVRTDPRRAGTEAFHPLVAPLLTRCAEGQRLCLVPHDALHLVPLHAVVVDGRPLAERNPVSYVPAAGLLRYTAGTGPAVPGTVLMADSRADGPLVHARVQVSEIARLAAPPVRVLTGEEVTLDAVRSVAAGTWHVACHGEFDQGDPRRSGILLAEGRCTVADLMALRLDCDLVTFSACETGVAERAPGDELIGLTRALIHAGARAVLVSLWPVDEISTSILMHEFYRGLADGADKATALGEAQRVLRTMTASAAIAYCHNAKRHVEDTSVLDRDIADLRFQAFDFAAAAAGYAELAARAEPGTAGHRDLTAAVSRARRAQRAGATTNYDVHPYEQPYHWAAFVLVGDGK
ncbi:CHAT domain-containing protein [Lentzea sp. CA-135723]|uniref:CHAT domain-containing protein n=1 Tax=Lentzea sp. CA-135723 TaxID=3239950 RepID=UPI003D926369